MIYCLLVKKTMEETLMHKVDIYRFEIKVIPLINIRLVSIDFEGLVSTDDEEVVTIVSEG